MDPLIAWSGIDGSYLSSSLVARQARRWHRKEDCCAADKIAALSGAVVAVVGKVSKECGAEKRTVAPGMECSKAKIATLTGHHRRCQQGEQGGDTAKWTVEPQMECGNSKNRATPEALSLVGI
mmetsp:Transcript_11524/g.25284  ORF Transcript_11524/g.25284 Transcript_11524/m.25284 type:complete len:123 (+) Transcript_11524:162-530(+)